MTPRARVLAVATGLAVVPASGRCAARGPAAPGPGGGAPDADAAAAGNGNADNGGPLGGRPAPDFTLVNQFGQPMSLSQVRGMVVLLSFDDAPCTTVCQPLTRDRGRPWPSGRFLLPATSSGLRAELRRPLIADILAELPSGYSADGHRGAGRVRGRS